MKTDKRQITEEELAAYIDGCLSKTRSLEVESSLTDDTLELIGVTRAAIQEVPEECTAIFPVWDGIAATVHPFFLRGTPLAMAGFLGTENAADVASAPEDFPGQDEPDEENEL